MTLSLEQVDYIANLARLEITQAEKELYRRQLSAILDYAARLQSLDVSEIPPTASVLAPHTALRADEPRPGLAIGDLMANAPQAENNQFRVPPVLEQESPE
jgi:aspartyl-tRNA(Asn)/glutamyl-tRNA(Gln) amidotransferase subunit C